MDLQIQVSVPDEIKNEIIEAIANKIMESVSDEIKQKVVSAIPEKPAETTFTCSYPNKFTPPTLEEITEFVYEEKLGINPAKFLNFYTERNWIDKKGFKVTDWKAKIKSWDDYNTNQKKDLSNGYYMSGGKVYRKEAFDPNAIDKINITE